MTVFLGVLNLKTGHITYINAGHEYPMIYRKGQGFEMFGNDRLLKALNDNAEADMKELDIAVRKAVDDFVAGAEQFDDMTTLCIRFFSL